MTIPNETLRVVLGLVVLGLVLLGLFGLAPVLVFVPVLVLVPVFVLVPVEATHSFVDSFLTSPGPQLSTHPEPLDARYLLLQVRHFVPLLQV